MISISSSLSAAQSKQQQNKQLKPGSINTTSVVETRTLYTLQKILDKSTPDHFMMSLKLDQTAPWTSLSLENHGSFLQLRLPDSMTMNPGQFQDTEGPFISKIATFQPDPSTIIVRFFLRSQQTPSEDIAKATSVEVLGEHIIVSTELTPPRPTAMAASAAIPITTPDSTQKAQTAPPAAIQSPLIEPQAQAITPTAEAQTIQADDLSRKVAIGVMLVIALFTLFTFLHTFFRKKMGKSHPLPAQMQVLNTIQLSPKQKITLIQVENQKLLLSVSNDQVQVIPEFKDALQSFQYNAQPNNNRATIRNPEKPKREHLTASQERPVETQPHVDPLQHEQALPRQASETQESVDDITKLIREKLRQYPGARA